MNRNYLDLIPRRNVLWTESDNSVTLEVENKGFLNRFTHIFFNRARSCYVHLDALGSFIWCNIDGEKTVYEIGNLIKKEFGESAEPLFERLVKFFEILKSYKFITWKL